MEWRFPKNALGRIGRVANCWRHEEVARDLCVGRGDASGTRRLILIGLFAILAPTLVWSTRVAPMSPEQVLAQADLIIVASIKGVEPRQSDNESGVVFTDYTLLIDQVLFDRDGLFKSQAKGSQYHLSFVGGGEVGGRLNVAPGVPAFSLGEMTILFVSSEDIGSISPLVGVTAGAYRVSSSVDHSGSVLGPSGLVLRRSFFSESDDVTNGFTLGGFIEEIKRALPIAQADPALQRDQIRQLVPVGSTIFTGSQIPQATPLGEGVVPVPSQGTELPAQDTTKPADPDER